MVLVSLDVVLPPLQGHQAPIFAFVMPDLPFLAKTQSSGVFSQAT